MFFKDKTILVIGGTGTIGTSVVKEILKDSPKKIKIFSRDEYKQHQVREMFGHHNAIHFLIGDIRDASRVEEVMSNVDYVLHLAAMKRVDACEENPMEAVETNIVGSANVRNAAIKKNVKKVIFTSSDKAISPTNTYGATKLIAERLLANPSSSSTKFASVRFGNVMGSRGSVIPLFQEQIKMNQKITITDPKMTRFMMTLSQATSLTLQALKESKGGEVFVLKMPVIRLGDLADLLIQHSGSPVTTEYIGLKPGEKMYEELMTYDESQQAWELEDMFVIPSESARVYPDSKKVKHGTYRSNDQEVVTKEQLQQLLLEAGFLEKR
ncbi:SDR family NAD(P)-dependent oxidoreductase [Gracilibacillus kekensis]|uniref:Polysaccharide biosynthesis protein n=1 Tax=Gracilibacillus kekensis TaxID=1027249 RepID=A0A1M7NTA3_9BACI|nr:SDR family NAD(P)-dependent oxidoreductase [Gracilibacillus kekensis]SHN07245.1 Polysaccharide biosynthesis protein [Gracilibacillus kekensis]